jgi:anti-sigma B factor antagonist
MSQNAVATATLICGECGNRTPNAQRTNGTKRCRACDGPISPKVATPRQRGACVVEALTDGEAAVVKLTGDLDLSATDLRSALSDACEQGVHVILDLSEVTLIDSASLGALVRAHQYTKRNGRALCLVAPSRFIVTVLHTMRLLRIFPILGTVEQARAWLQSSDASSLH